MSKERELLKRVWASERWDMPEDLQIEIKELLAQPEFGDGPEFDGWEKRSGNSLMQEPIAWKVVDSIGEFMFSSVKPMKRSYKYDLIIPLYDSINDNPTFGDISMHNDEELDEHFRNRIDIYADKHPTLLVRQLAERLRKEWNKIEEPEQEPVAWKDKTYGNLYKVDYGNSIPLYLAPPKRDPIDLDQVDNHLKICDLSEDYRDGYSDGIIYAEREHKIRGKYE